MDVVGAYLHSDIDVPIYMEQAEIFASKDPSDFVWKLNKSIYGLKQSGRNWNFHLNRLLLELGFVKCEGDPCVYHKPGVILAVYVDDLLLVGEEGPVLESRQMLAGKLDIKDFGDVTNFLSLNIQRPRRDQLFVDQSDYIEEVLREMSMNQARGVSAPLEIGCMNIDRTDVEPFCQEIHRQGTGYLQYIATVTRPDISNAACLVSQFNQAPCVMDFNNVKHVFQYLKSTKNYALHYSKTGKAIQIYTDADWANNRLDAKSISGYCILLGGGVVSWRSRKQKCVASSSTHAEYIAMYEGATEFEWMKGLLVELGQGEFVPKPCPIFADNNPAIDIANNNGVSDRTKHINVKYHYIRDLVERGVIEFKYVKSKENLADLLTKPLTGPVTAKYAKSLGIFPL